MFADPQRRESGLNAGIIALVLAVVFFVAARTQADPDLWGHVRFGQDILSSGIPAADSYSYLNGNDPWINHELLAEVLFGAAFNFLGVSGLVAVKTAFALLMFGLLYRHLWRRGMDEAKAGIVIVAVLMLMSVGLWTIRPQLLTYVLFLVTLLLIECAERGSKAAAWILPVVMFVWANSHGGFLAGLAVVGIWVTVRIASLFGPEAWRIRSGPSPLTACTILVLCGSAALLNPYGFRLITFLLHTATVPRPEIGEWQPLSIMTAEGITYLVVIGVTIGALLWSKRPRHLSTMAVLLVVALLPLLALRHLPLFGLAFAVFVGEHLADVWSRNVTSTNSGSTLLKLMPWPIAGVFFVAAIPHFSCIRIDPAFIRFPVRAVAVMKSARVEGNVATFFDWGEYLIWHLSPNVRVSVDGRRETVYSPESYTRSLQFMYGVGQWDAILERPETDMALVGRDQPTYALMRLKPGWQQVYEDSFSSLFVREGSMLAERIRNVPPPQAPPDGVGLCFPCNLADAAREEE